MTHTNQRTAVLLDPYPLWLDAVEDVLSGAGVGVVGTATSTPDALALVERHRPHLFVMETEIPGDRMDGIACLRRVCEQSPATKVVVLSSRAAAQSVEAAFAAGATAYVVKTSRREDVASAIRQTFDHSVYFATEVSARAADGASADRGAHPAERRSADPDSPLTKREREILRLVADGRSNADLARMLWVTEQTVKFHLSNIYRKLGVSNRTEASRWAQLHGLLPRGARMRAGVSSELAGVGSRSDS